MTLKKNDFVEIQFTGKTQEGQVFDSNIKEDLDKLRSEVVPKNLIFPLGSQMFLKGVEDFLIGKEPGKYELSLTPENAFGLRNPNLIQLMPLKVFTEQKLRPAIGFTFNFDGKMGKVISASGGRVRVDFNHPLAGKPVNYSVNVLRTIEDTGEKIKALNESIFRKKFDFEIKETKLVMQVEKQLAKFVEMFKDPFKEFLGLDLEVKEIADKEKEHVHDENCKHEH